MIFRILIMIFDIMGAVFNLWQYRDTEYKGFLTPSALFLIAWLVTIISIIIY